MSSVGSGSTEYPNRAYSPRRNNDEEFDSIAECRPLHPRRPSSYEEMDQCSDAFTTEGQFHQYEDPRVLAEQLRRAQNPPPPCSHSSRPRKKTNDLYERCRTGSNDSENSKRGSNSCCGPLCIFVFLSFVFALAAVALVTLLILGHLPGSCGKCLNPVHPEEANEIPIRTGASSKSSPDENVKMLKMIKDLQTNLTKLFNVVKHKDHIIEELLENDRSHAKRLVEPAIKELMKNVNYNMSKMRGPRGSRGPQGPQGIEGKKGSGNISTCVYQVKKTNYSPSPTSGHDVFVLQDKGWLIISATCSTEGSAESNLTRMVSRNGVQYSCQCRGKSVQLQASATCYIHYWKCPII